MRAVILAAGEGMRLRPLTANMPKVMIPVGNKPILEYVINSLKGAGIDKITIVVGYHKDKVMQYFGSGKEFGVEINYVFQRKQLGTGHALLQARVDEDFILVYGDNLIEERCIRDIIDSEVNTILATVSDRAYAYGVLDTEGDRVRRVVEKPNVEESCLVFSGIAHMGPEVFNYLEESISQGLYNLTHILGEMGFRYKVSNCEWLDVVYPYDLLRVNGRVLRKNVRKIAGIVEDARIIGNVEIGENTRIGAGAYIRGNVKIGDNCVIGPNSVILGDTSIGDGVTIGALSLVENSIIMDDSRIGEASIVRDSVIGREVSIGARFTALSGERKKVMKNRIVTMSGGTIIGDGAEIGAAVITGPCVSIGVNAKVSDLKIIREDIEDGVSVV